MRRWRLSDGATTLRSPAASPPRHPDADAVDLRRQPRFLTAAPEELWLPVGSDFATINVESQLADPNSSLNLYRRLLALRRESAAMALGEWQLHNGSDRHCLVYTRRAGSESKLVALNLTDQTREVDQPAGDGRALDQPTARGRVRGRPLPLPDGMKPW